jgi:putative oxidoreductase
MNGRLRTGLCAVALPARVYLGCVFIAASIYKIAEPSQFGLSIATYEILPLEYINAMAILLPWMEMVTGITLIAGFWTRASALAIGGMMVMFIAAIGITLSRDLPISCGCFASAEAGDEISWATVVRDSVWLGMALYVVIVDDGRFGLDGLWRWWRRRGKTTQGT